MRHQPPELAIARGQHGVVTRWQLGLSKEAVRHRLRTRRLHRIHPGVYAVGRPDLTREGIWMAAVLACGDDAVLSHRSAAVLWGVLDREHRHAEVSVPTDTHRRGPSGVLLHRTPGLVPQDVTRRLRIPVTTLERTIIDTARVLERPALKGVVRQAERIHRLDLVALHARVQDAGPDVARARLRRLLVAYVPVALTESELEARFFELCHRHRLPRPQRQLRIGRYRADFAWPDVRLVVETDGREAHGGHVPFLDDRVKDRALRAAGWEVLRYTWGEVVHTPGDVAREIRAARRRRRCELGDGASVGS